MAFKRSYLYNDREQQLSFYAHALAYPARPRIILQLTDEESLSVEELKTLHPLSKATISQHLKILRDTDLVNYREEFPFTFYSLNPKNISKLKKELSHFLDNI
jgi:DNA-binding transcriptional ArsR family regulator